MSTQTKKDKITKENIGLNKISLGKLENKISGNFRYEITPVLYEKKPFQITVYGKIKFFSFNNKSFSVGVTIDKENKDFFVLRKKYQIFMVKNYTSSKHLMGIQEFMQNFLQKMGKFKHQSKYYVMGKRKLTILWITLEFHFREGL